MNELFRDHTQAFVVNASVPKARKIVSDKGIETLFPEWDGKNEKIAFICAHEDDALAKGSFGHHYIIYDRISDEEGIIPNSMETDIKVPKYAIVGTKEDALFKGEVLKNFKSQPNLFPLFNNLPDKRFEFFFPFKKVDTSLKKEYFGYSNIYKCIINKLW